MKHSVRNRICLIAVTVMLVFGLFPAPGLPAASAAEADTIYAAAYMGATTAAETTLPESIDSGGRLTDVVWHIGDDTFAVPYETVTVTGTAGGSSIVAEVEVIPPSSHPLAYFVDSGRGGDSLGNPPSDSPLYEAVRQLTGDALLNDVPDQRYVSGSTAWGFDDSAHKVKNSKDGGHTDPAVDPSKWVVGLRTDPSSEDIVYRLLPLAPGTYTLSSGFHDWYGNRNRQMHPKIEYQDTNGETKTILLDPFNTNATRLTSSEFTIPADIDASVPVTLRYDYVSGEKPILSWFAVAEGGIKGLIEDAWETAASTVHVLLDGNDIQADNRNGLTFKGFGVLTGNSSSALLMDYKAEHPEAYAELLHILFGGEHPLMTHVKIEMGNDRNNSTGPDPATMRTADEEANVTRHPGFQLAADAKAVNPDLKVSILRWSAPAWADNNNDNIYKWYKNTILAAYREYGYMVDYVNPHINEHAPDLAWTKQYAERVRTDGEGFDNAEEQSLYNRIGVVISDEVGIGSFGGAMVNDVSLREAVSAAAYHYNTDDDGAGNFKRLAEQFDIEVWNSEAQATFSNSAFRPNNNTKDPSVAGTGIGGTNSALEMGNTIIKGFVNSRRTHFIYQPAIGSFYEGGQYSFKELISARDPWSGWIHYDAGLLILRHFGWFANAGWENETNTAGIWRAVPQASYTGATGTNPVNGRNGTPSYMTLAAPDKCDFSTVIINDSEYERIYKLQTVNMGYAGNPDLEVWETRAADAGEAFNSNYLQYLGQASADGSGTYTVRVKPYSIVTVTTLDNRDNEAYHAPLPVEGERTVLDTDSTGSVRNTEDDILYADDFDYSDLTVPVIGEGGQMAGDQSYVESRGGSKGAIPRYTHDRNGAFEAYLPDGSDNYVLRQQLDRNTMGLGGTWNGGDPVTAIGDYRWTNYKASVDVSFENDSTEGGANYAAIGARYQGGGSSHTIGGTPYVLKFWFDGGWQLLVDNRAVASGNVATGSGGVRIDGFDAAHDAWHNIAIQVAGNRVTAYLDDAELASYEDPNPKLSGRVDLASGYYHVRFDNLRVEQVDGYAPYYSEALDNLEMHDLASVPNPKLIYSGAWAHNNGQSMYHYQRSLSASQGADAALTYTFTGTGLDLLGPNGGSAKLEVTVDGQTVLRSAGTMASRELYQTYALRGLAYGEHTVEIKAVSGTLVVDAVAVVSGEVQGAPDTAALRKALNEAEAIERRDDYREQDWQLFEAAMHAARAALVDPEAYRLDQEGADQLAERLIYARNQLITGDIRELGGPHYSAAYVGSTPDLPEQVEATHEDGTTSLVPVTWHLDDLRFDDAYETVTVTGSYGSLETVAYVEVVPEDILYFADLNATATGLTPGHNASNTLGYDSPAYVSVAALAEANGKPLLNDAPDQVYDSADGWGHRGFNAGGSPTVSYKGIVAGAYSKQQTTGIYTANQNGASLTYAFDDLPAGEYVLTVGTYSWWPSPSRTEEIYLEYEGNSMLADTVTLDGNSFDVVRGYPFILNEPGSVTLRLKAINNQSPMLSFAAVAPVKAADKSALQSYYDEHKDKENDGYPEAEWSNFQEALERARLVLAAEDATQTEVNDALQALMNAVAMLGSNSELILHYDMKQIEGSAVKDLVGAFDGTWINQAKADWIHNEEAGAVYFAGGSTDSYIEMPQGVLDGLQDVTVSALVHWNGAAKAHWVYTFGQDSSKYLYYTPDYPNTAGGSRLGMATNAWNNEVSAQGPRLPANEWKLVTTVMSGKEGKLALYVDGLLVATADTPYTLGDIRKTQGASGFIGQSMYAADPYFGGMIADFQVYDGALNSLEIAELKTAADEKIAAMDGMIAGYAAENLEEAILGDNSSLDRIVSDLNLIGTGPLGTQIQWTSSNEAVISKEGAVTRPSYADGNQTVTLTAVVSDGTGTVTKPITVTVISLPDDAAAVALDKAALIVRNIDDVRGHLTLPTAGENGTAITWSSEDPSVVTPTGEVTRPANGNGDIAVTLTATIAKNETADTKTFEAIVRELPVREDYAGYFFSYFTGEGTSNGEQIYFALSEGNDPLNWQELHDGQPVITSELGEKGLRDPFIIRSPEGDKFYMIATDLKIHGNGDWTRAQTWGSRSIMVWESNDLIDWSEQRMVEVAPPEAGNAWAPEAYYDETTEEYVVFWASKIYADETHTGSTYNKMMYATTRDFYTFTEAKPYIDLGYSVIDTTMIRQDGRIYRFSKDERNNSASAPYGKMIFQEVGDSVLDDSFDLIKEGVGGIQGVEGPTIFKSNTEDKWYLFVDEFGGRGYVPLETTDLASGEWVLSSGYDLPARPRHGTVIPITQTEHDAIYAAYLAETVPVTGVSLDRTALTLKEGEQAKLTATVLPSDAANKSVVWSSSDESVATVDADGLVTAAGAGTAIVTVTTAEGGFAATAEITVEADEMPLPGEVSNVEVTPGDRRLSLTWEDPANIAQVKLVLSGGSTVTEAVYVDQGVERYVATDLTNGTDYTVRISTIDLEGYESAGISVTGMPAASPPEDTTPPGEVTDPRVAAGNQRLTLQWTDPTDGDLAFIKISGRGSTVTEAVYVNPGVETYLFSGLANGTYHEYLITTLDTHGNESSGVAVGGTPRSPSGGGGTPSGGGTNPPAAPDHEAEVADNGQVNVKPTIGADGSSTVTLNAQTMRSALELTEGGKLRIRVEAAENLTSLEIELPVEELLADDERSVDSIEIDTGLAVVTLSAKLIAKAAEAAKTVTLSVAIVDVSGLPAETQAQLNNATAYDFALAVDGVAVGEFDGRSDVLAAVPYELQPGEHPNKVVIYYINDNGALEVVTNGKYDASTGMAEFKPKHFSNYAAAYADASFADVANAWAKEPIEALAARGIVSGTGEGRFNPDGVVTRAEFIAMLVHAFDLTDADAKTTFSDVRAGAWYYDEVATAERLGIVHGRTDGSFGARDPITRQEMAVMAYQAAQYAQLGLTDAGAEDFADHASIAAYAREAVAAMQAAGIISGMGNGDFAPQSHATRAQAAVIVHRMLLLM